MKPVKVGILGLGTVGSSVFNLLNDNAIEIARRVGRTIEVAHIGARRDHPDCDMSSVTVSRDLMDVLDDDSIDIVVELIGGTTLALELVLKAIAKGKHVVTANKALIAEYGNEIFAAAQQQGVTVTFEAAVAGGIPIIKSIREGLSANHIEWVAGIINGTGNFILTEMRDKGRDFADVLAEAQALGYAEADPTFDVEGIDAAHKLAILGSVAFGVPLQFPKVFTEGISEITPQDVEYAAEFGYQIKHLGITRKVDAGVELRVHPTLIPSSRIIANVDGVMNAVLVKSDKVGATLYYGPGAGGNPTASAVVADVVDVARVLTADPTNRVPHLAFQPDALAETPILSMEEVETSYYLRLAAEDKSGVLADVTSILSKKGISIQAVMQKEPAKDQTAVPVVILTHTVVEKEMNAALLEIEALPAISGKVVRIRMEQLDE
ncbi:MAG: homoserine dehydrogenase [Gammaproteobacteria bacterium]|nr:MAG: homoserine dehydrogenase [Gammaproteobacteria bacterium]